MPELPEVETVVRDVRPHLLGRRIVGVRAGSLKLRKPWSARWQPLLIGQRIDAVSRRGKWIVLHLDNGARLVVHLGMTGQLRSHERSDPTESHTHLVFTLDDGRELRYRDIRRFGSVTCFADPQALADFLEGDKLGPEPFDLDPTAWRERLAKTRRNLKATLLDQGVVAGVGNIYADEALFEARLHPARQAADLTKAEADRLRKAIAAVLDRAIKRRGSSIRNYVGGSGLQGEFQKEFRVYGRTGQPCPRCRGPIERIRLAGRSTHFCPHCQKDSPQRHREHREDKNRKVEPDG
jgi:formamidopyrimidine-DNA glycosylase